MPERLQTELSRRERQVMAIVYNRKSASVLDVRRELPDPPSYSAVRSIVNILESKGFLKHGKNGKKYVYFAAIAPRKAMKAALRQLIKTHFDDSIEKAITAILETHNGGITEDELNRLAELIDKIRAEEKK